MATTPRATGSPASSASTSTSAEPALALDADSHLLEGTRFLADHAPAALADDLALDAIHDDRPGASNPVGRLAVLDELGVDGQLVLTTAAAPFVAGLPVALRLDAARAHNRAVAAWCAAAGARCWPVAFVPRHDPTAAAALVGEALALGCRAVHLPSDPSAGPAPDDAAHAPLWAALADAGVPFVLHVATGGRLVPRGWHGAASAGEQAGGGDGVSAFELAVAHQAPERFLTALVLGGVLARHPGLRGLVLEQGAGWVPPWLARLDGIHAAFSRAGLVPPLGAKPSAGARGALGFAPHPFEVVAELVAAGGSDLWLWASDFPHVEGGRDPAGRATWALDDDGAERAFRGGNLARLLGG